VEGLEKKIAEEEGLKKKSEEKSMKISAKTRSRLALLLSKTGKAVDTQEKQTVRYLLTRATRERAVCQTELLERKTQQKNRVKEKKKVRKDIKRYNRTIHKDDQKEIWYIRGPAKHKKEGDNTVKKGQ
jgi:hypothetical protein